MVHVRFNEKVECHQYDTTTGTETGTKLSEEIDAVTTNRPELVDTAIVHAGASRLNYDSEFLKTLRDCPLAQTCPDVLKNANGITRGLVRKDPLKPYNPMTSTRQIGKRNMFDRQLQLPSQNYGRPNHLKLNQRNDSDGRIGNNHRTYNAALPPIGVRNSRFNAEQMQFKMPQSFPDYAQCTQISHGANMSVESDHDVKPEWYSAGPTSKYDCVELHGFVGEEATEENKKRSFESDDGNISCGASSPPAKSTPAKSTPAKSTPAKSAANDTINDSRRSNRFARPNHWSTNPEPRQNSVPRAFYELLRNAQPSAPPNFNFGGQPVRNVQDIEADAFDHLKFRQMIAQLKVPQNVNGPRNAFFEMLRQSNTGYYQQPMIPNASQILFEIEKILMVSAEPIFKRSEVRTLIRNIVESIIPPQEIMNLLKNPLTEPQYRDTVIAVINLISTARVNATNVLQFNQPVHPSHAQLQAHTDAIMQNAIIKKKLERLNSELLRIPKSPAASMNQSFRPGGDPNQRNFAWQQHNSPAVNSPQRMARGQGQRGEATSNTQADQLKQWFSPALWSRAAAGELPNIHTLREALVLEEYERSIKEQLLKGKEN